MRIMDNLFRINEIIAYIRVHETIPFTGVKITSEDLKSAEKMQDYRLTNTGINKYHHGVGVESVSKNHIKDTILPPPTNNQSHTDNQTANVTKTEPILKVVTKIDDGIYTINKGNIPGFENPYFIPSLLIPADKKWPASLENIVQIINSFRKIGITSCLYPDIPFTHDGMVLPFYFTKDVLIYRVT